MIREMRHLAAKADVITPNLTELFYLMDKPYKADNTDEELKSYLRLFVRCRTSGSYYYKRPCPWRKSQDFGICLQSGRRSLLENNLSLSACSLSGNGGIPLRASSPEPYCKVTAFLLPWTVPRNLSFRVSVPLLAMSTITGREFCLKRYCIIWICLSRAPVMS